VPRYFFHTRIGADALTDDEGVELRDPDQAWRVARATIRASLEEEGSDPRLVTAILVVTDEFMPALAERLARSGYGAFRTERLGPAE
jgi:hypothetical protein